MGLALAGTAVVIAWPLLVTYLATGLVPRFPTAVLAMGLMTLGFMSFVTGLLLDTVTLGRRELKRLHYLALRAVERRTTQSSQRDGNEATWKHQRDRLRYRPADVRKSHRRRALRTIRPR